MKALTIWQPWASLIVMGLKPAEFRNWHAPRSMIGSRIAIHAGAHPVKPGVQDLLASDDRITGSCGADADVQAIREYLEAIASRGYAMERSAVLGTVILGEPLRADTYYQRKGWSVGEEGPWAIAWPMLDPEEWFEPVPMKGAQGFWDYPGFEGSPRESSIRALAERPQR